MKKQIEKLPYVLLVTIFVVSCGHYPALINNVKDIENANSNEYMIKVGDLPLADWPRLQKFVAHEHFSILRSSAPSIGDEHVLVLSGLEFPKLRQVSFAYCSKVTDDGIGALTKIPSIQGLHLIGAGITDQGLQILATGFPNLRGINVMDCGLLTAHGFSSLRNSKTIASVGLSSDSFSQEQLEHIITTLPNITWWTIGDPGHRLDHSSLQQLGEASRVTIQVVDERNFTKTITKREGKKGSRRL